MLWSINSNNIVIENKAKATKHPKPILCPRDSWPGLFQTQSSHGAEHHICAVPQPLSCNAGFPRGEENSSLLAKVIPTFSFCSLKLVCWFISFLPHYLMQMMWDLHWLLADGVVPPFAASHFSSAEIIDPTSCRVWQRHSFLYFFASGVQKHQGMVKLVKERTNEWLSYRESSCRTLRC